MWDEEDRRRRLRREMGGGEEPVFGSYDASGEYAGLTPPQQPPWFTSTLFLNVSRYSIDRTQQVIDRFLRAIGLPEQGKAGETKPSGAEAMRGTEVVSGTEHAEPMENGLVSNPDLQLAGITVVAPNAAPDGPPVTALTPTPEVIRRLRPVPSGAGGPRSGDGTAGERAEERARAQAGPLAQAEALERGELQRGLEQKSDDIAKRLLEMPSVVTAPTATTPELSSPRAPLSPETEARIDRLVQKVDWVKDWAEEHNMPYLPEPPKPRWSVGPAPAPRRLRDPLIKVIEERLNPNDGAGGGFNYPMDDGGGGYHGGAPSPSDFDRADPNASLTLSVALLAIALAPKAAAIGGAAAIKLPPWLWAMVTLGSMTQIKSSDDAEGLFTSATVAQGFQMSLAAKMERRLLWRAFLARQRAGGEPLRAPWRAHHYQENAPGVVQQTGDMACGAACGEMVTEGALTQEQIIARSGISFEEGIQAEHLADTMNALEREIGAAPRADGRIWWALDNKDAAPLRKLAAKIQELTRSGKESFVASLQWGELDGVFYGAEEFEALWAAGHDISYNSHFVVVDGIDAGTGLVIIRDPGKAASYGMTLKDFHRWWYQHVRVVLK